MRPVVSGGSPLTLADDLAAQELAWETRPLLRRLYRSWFALLAARLSTPGPTIELGAGIARFKEIVPEAIATDVEPTPWTEVVVDAQRMPYRDGSVGNVVLFDVFHHLADPAGFLDEARRVLRPGGRVLVIDPYCSPLSTAAYRTFHHERTDVTADPFAVDADIAGRPMASNQARSTLVFFRHADELQQRWPELALVERKRFSFILYPLSGGFSRRPLLPRALWLLGELIEQALRPLAPLLAFRCLVVLERRR